MPPAKKQKVELQFPIEGQVEGTGHANQKPNTTSDCKNVRPFDVEEDRARGGRRDGVSKVTSTALSSNKIDHIQFVQRANENTVYEVAGLSEFPEDSQYSNHIPIFNFPAIPVGTQITEGNAGHEYFCRALQIANSILDGNTLDWPNSQRASYMSIGPFHESEFTSGAPRWWLRKPIRMFDFAGLTKRFDSQNNEYIDINPTKWGYAGAPEGAPSNEGDGSPATTHADEHKWRTFESFIDLSYDNIDGFRSGYGQTYNGWNIDSSFFLSPQTEISNAPWSSYGENSYSVTLEFAFPQGLPERAAVANNDKNEWHFVSSADEVTEPYEIYDPYYIQCQGANAPASGSPHKWWVNHDQQAGNEQGKIWCGIILRTNIDHENASAFWSNHYYRQNQNPSNQHTPMAFFFQQNDMDSSVVDLVFMGGMWKNNVTDHIGQQIQTTFFDGWYAARKSDSPNSYRFANVFGGDNDYDENGNRKKHKLVITVQGNSLTLTLDGQVLENSQATTEIDDVTSSEIKWHVQKAIADPGNGEDDTKSFHRSMLVYGHRLNILSGGDFTEEQYQTFGKGALKYFGTFDHYEMSDSSGNTANSANPNNLHNWGLGLKVYNWEWRDVDPVTIGRKHVTAVSNGNVFSTTPDDLSNFTLRSTAQDLSTNINRIDGTSFFENVYFVDGSNYKYFDASQMKVLDWNTLDGDGEINTNATLPGGNGDTGLHGIGTSDCNARCTIIKSWLGRLVMAGKADEPQNWFMSAVGDATDFDPDSASPGASVWGSKSENIGEISDPIIAIAPSIDNRLIISTSNYIYAMTGDPLWDGTQLVSISTEVGFIGPDAWCYGPNRVLYFMGPNGLYALAPNEFNITQTNRLSSGKLDKTFKDLDLSSSACKLVYDNVNHGVHIFLTPANQSTDKRSHYFYDSRTNSFWPMEYPGVIGPTYVMDFQSPNPEANKILLGGFDGHIRSFSSSAQDDDGTIIDSHVWIGPISLSSTQEVKLTEMLAILDEQTPGLSYEVYAADTVEQAKSGTPIFSGRWNGGRNNYVRTRARGAAIFIKLLDGTKQDPWAMERLAATLAVAGRARIR